MSGMNVARDRKEVIKIEGKELEKHLVLNAWSEQSQVVTLSIEAWKELLNRIDYLEKEVKEMRRFIPPQSKNNKK